jgi:hypothetical protein
MKEMSDAEFQRGKELWRRFRRKYLELKGIAFEIEGKQSRKRRGRKKEQSMVTLLNTSIITGIPGKYEIHEIGVADAQATVFQGNWQSAIGHEATAQVLSELLQVTIPVNRIEYKQQPRERAIVFKLRGRVEEGKILNREEIEAIGYDLYLLTREE